MYITTNLSAEKVKSLIKNLESEKVERTISKNDTDKYAKAVCAFSNDLSKSGMNGYLLIGVDDKGNLSGMEADDGLLTRIGGLRADGNILPQPIISVDTFSYPEGDVVVIEVQPSPFPPVRYKGDTWIRVGARMAIANEMEERILIEKRISNVSTFDIRPSVGENINSINLDIIRSKYLPNAIDSNTLENDNRNIEEQLESLRFFSSNYGSVTHAALILFGKSPERLIPGAYIQYVKFAGKSVASLPVNEKKFSSSLAMLLPELDTFIKYVVIEERPVPVSALREKMQYNYPTWAIRELLMNAIMHRDYESNAPVKFYQFSDRIEISNPGGLFGNARPENFPNVSDYRNPVVSEGMKVLGYVNKFNRGISKVKEDLRENGNSMPIFDYSNIGTFSVIVKSTYVEDIPTETGSPESGSQKSGSQKKTAHETAQKMSQEEMSQENVSQETASPEITSPEKASPEMSQESGSPEKASPEMSQEKKSQESGSSETAPEMSQEKKSQESGSPETAPEMSQEEMSQETASPETTSPETAQESGSQKTAQKMSQESASPETAPEMTQESVSQENDSQKNNYYKVFEIIKNDNYLTTSEIANQLKISRKTVTRYIAKLKKEGIIERVGPNKGGFWKILK